VSSGIREKGVLVFLGTFALAVSGVLGLGERERLRFVGLVAALFFLGAGASLSEVEDTEEDVAAFLWDLELEAEEELPKVVLESVEDVRPFINGGASVAAVVEALGAAPLVVG